MKLFIKFLLLVLILGLAAPFFLKRPDGKPWLNIDDFIPDLSKLQAELDDSLDSAERQLEKATSDDANAGKTKVYRWRDSSGNWHLSDRPIDEAFGRDETIYVDPDTNLIEGVSPSQTESELDSPEPVSNAIPLPMTVSPAQAEKLMDDARGVQELMDQRAEQLNKL